MPLDKEFYTAREAAEILCLHIDTIRGYLRLGILAYDRLGPHGNYRIPKSALNKFKEKPAALENTTKVEHIGQDRAVNGMDVIAMKILEEDIKDHLREIQTLIEKWNNMLKTPRIEILEDFASELRFFPENEPLYDCLRQHLPLKKLWEDQAEWHRLYHDYLLDRMFLMTYIESEAEGWPNISQITFDFTTPILRQIRIIAEGSSIQPHRFEKRKNLDIDYDDKVLSYEIFVVDSWEVLKAPNALANIEAYEEMSNRYLQSDLAHNLVEYYRKLTSIESRLHKRLQEASIGRHYKRYECRLCPGQS